MNLSMTVNGRTCDLICGKDVYSALLRRELAPRGALVFTDETVLKYHRERIEELGFPVFAMRPGEAYKTPQTLFALLARMAEERLRRNSVLISIGGGTVCDVGGLAASLYMRGISLVLCPTTLLAQADAAVGGKTAVDFCGIKNLLGTFYLPESVYIDSVFLETLPAREIRCGLGEIVKHGALSKELFEKLKACGQIDDRKRLFDWVLESVAFKRALVERDPFEQGERKILNLGHTTAHILELANASEGASCNGAKAPHGEGSQCNGAKAPQGEGALSHGECVLCGLVLEARIASSRLRCDTAFLRELEAMCMSVLGMDSAAFAKEMEKLVSEELVSRALYDKKNRTREKVSLIVPVRAGACEELELSPEAYLRALEEAVKC